MGNNVFVRFDDKNEPEMLVAQSEATRGSADVSRFVDGTNGGVFLYESDLLNERARLVNDLGRLAEFVGTDAFDELYDHAAAVGAAKRTPQLMAAMAKVQAAPSVREEAATAKSAYMAKAVGVALEQNLEWIVETLKIRNRPSGDRRITPVTRLTIRQWRDDDGQWHAESDELPGVYGTGESRATAIASAQAAHLRAMADLIEAGDADEVHGVLFQIKAPRRRRKAAGGAEKAARTGV